jgi:hypothetical protein
MRTLRLFLFFVAMAGLLFGLADAVALLLGGATRDHLLATGFVVLALGLGAVHRGAGHVPLRASFLLLGLGGALPLLAGFAPVSTAFAVFLFLPIRAIGAQLTSAIESHKAGASLFAFGSTFGLLIFSHAGIGLPGFLAVWAVAGILQRLIFPPLKDEKKTAQSTPADPRPPLAHLLPNLLAGCGLTLLVLFLLPYTAMFDSGASDQDLRRWMTVAVCFFACWFTFGATFASADGKLRTITATVSTLGLGLAIGPLARHLTNFATPEVYGFWLSNTRLRAWSGSDAPVLPEESAFYVPWITVLSFGALTLIAALALRTLLRTERTSASSIAPLLAGCGVTLLLCGFTSSAMILPHVGTLAALILVIAAITFWVCNNGAGQARWIGVGLVVIAAGVGLRAVERPTIGFPLRDNYLWQQQTAGEQSDWPQGAALNSTGWVSTPRNFTRTASAQTEQENMSFLFDSRTQLTAGPMRQPAQTVEVLLAAALTPNPQRILMVGSPEASSVATLNNVLKPEFTFACDPPQIVPLALDGLGVMNRATVQRSLATTNGPFDLVFMRNSGMWEERRSVLRVEALRQASLRLEPGGICAFACAPEQLMPGMLLQWILEYQRVFNKVSVFVLPDGMSNARLLILGSDGSSLTEGNWPIAQGPLAGALQHFGLPLAAQDDLLALEVQLEDHLSAGSYWMFRGPMRPTESLLAPTAYKLIAELENVKRAQAVLAELAGAEVAESHSLVAFFQAQFDAQQYSVHDTYLDRNPFAVETSEAALENLLATTRAHPSAESLVFVWQTLGVILVEQREIAWMSQYFSVLHEELGWSQPEILLVLAHAAIESLDFEGAGELVDEILTSAPNFNPAIELKKLVDAGETVPHDAHAGHNH